jgi:DNA-directed RNA polymerase subunit RPC12/RpoP
MAVLDKLKSVFGSEDRTFVYQCTECDHKFEADTPSASRASCPDCVDSRAVSVPGMSVD